MIRKHSRVAIVTGASSGIGEATVRELLAHGIAVVGNARRENKLRALEDEFGPQFHGVAGDITDHSTIDALFAATQTNFQQFPSIVIANAGRGLGGGIKEADLGRVESMLALNVSATLALMQKAAQCWSQDLGIDFPKTTTDFVVIGSVVGRNISPFSAVYGASKFAVHALTESLRRELAPEGIRVSLVEPGILLSGFQENAGYCDDMVNKFQCQFGPLISSEDVARTIYFIISQPAHINISDIVIRSTRQDYP